jgi:hypothetical protein
MTLDDDDEPQERWRETRHAMEEFGDVDASVSKGLPPRGTRRRGHDKADIILVDNRGLGQIDGFDHLGA